MRRLAWIMILGGMMYFSPAVADEKKPEQTAVRAPVEKSKTLDGKIEYFEAKTYISPNDGYVDLSHFILNLHGFVPIPVIVTEPAVGGFGLGVFPVFIKQNAPVEVDGKKYPVMPDVTMVGGIYTANNSWMGGIGQIGTIEKYGLNYKAFLAYADANLDFYKYVPRTGQTLKAALNIKATPVYFYLAKRLHDPRFVVGADYTFASLDLSPRTSRFVIPDTFQTDFKSVQSKLGVLVEFDSRDNTFTPDKGIKVNVNFRVSDKGIGSDFNFQQLEEAIYWYHPITERWISGLRVDMQQIFGSPPFYMKPFLDMRGVPAVKYQGDYTALMELEERYDFGETKRWSVVGFAGVGKAFDSMNDASDYPWVYNLGGGFRYLLAEKLKLRVGVDIAKSRDGWAWYIVFGNGWMRQ